MSDSGRVLVVDDDADLRWMLDRYLSRHGFDIITVEDGSQMREQLGEGTFDLIILDLSLPGEDGLSLARYLRENHEIGIIMLTAASEVVDRVIGLEMGSVWARLGSKDEAHLSSWLSGTPLLSTPRTSSTSTLAGVGSSSRSR